MIECWLLFFFRRHQNTSAPNNNRTTTAPATGPAIQALEDEGEGFSVGAPGGEVETKIVDVATTEVTMTDGSEFETDKEVIRVLVLVGPGVGEVGGAGEAPKLRYIVDTG